VDEREQGKQQNETKPRARHLVRHAITLLLLLVLIVTGVAAYYARQQWWDMYLSLTH
jgi:cell division septal protein FtsQ